MECWPHLTTLIDRSASGKDINGDVTVLGADLWQREEQAPGNFVQADAEIVPRDHCSMCAPITDDRNRSLGPGQAIDGSALEQLAQGGSESVPAKKECERQFALDPEGI
jgi:hypothetical protein